MSVNLLTKAQAIWSTALKSSGICQNFEKMVVTAATDQVVQAEFTVSDKMTNLTEGLHGGAAATVADLVSTIALMVQTGHVGSSVNLSVNYLKAAKLGDTLLVDSTTRKVGKTLAFLDITIKRKKDDAIIATANHVKFMGTPSPKEYL